MFPQPPRRFTFRNTITNVLSACLLVLTVAALGPAEERKQVPDWVVYPEREWVRITPEQAGLDAKKLEGLLAESNIHGGGTLGVQVNERQWGAVLTRGGYLVRSWGDPSYKYQSASLGKCIVRALFGLTVEAGLLKPDEPIWKTWTGRGQLSHAHKYLDEGVHRQLTWRHLLDHQGGFVLESGYSWRTKTMFHAAIPQGVRWTGDPLFDNFAHTPPGSVTRYSSGGYWRLGQALTALWNRDLKEVLDERLFRHLGIPAERWDWTLGKRVHDTKDFWPALPGYGEYIDPPYEINGHAVRGGPGWMVISSEDLARFGLLIASGGMWKGRRLIGQHWLRGHAGLDVHVVAGDPDSMVSIGKINTKGLPFGTQVGTQGRFAFPKDLIVGPVRRVAVGGSTTQQPSPPAPLRAPREAWSAGEGRAAAPARQAGGGKSAAAQPTYSVLHQTKVPVPMRDGVNLAAEVFRPDAPGKFPTLMLLRYFREGADRGQFFAKRGFAVALIDCRGRYDSGGTWLPYVNEPQDGCDAQQWLGTQPWSNGKIGTFGISYNGFTQTMPAPLGSPYLKCLMPFEGQQTNFGHLYNDGVMQLNVIFEFGLHTKQGSQTQRIFSTDHPHYRRLPLIAAVDDFPNVQHVKDWFKHCKYDDYWKAYGIKEKYGRIKVPAYFFTGWYDNLCHEGWRNFQGFRQQGGSEECRRGTKILVGPWTHGGSYGLPGLLDLQRRWYDRWLRGIDNGIDREPPIRIHVMGIDKWRDENEWPLARTRFTKFYLHSGGRANSLGGDGTLSTSPPQAESRADRFVYDPAHPIPTLGGQISTHADVWGPKDRRSVQERKDVLVYTTEPLTKDLEVTGPVNVDLYAASSAVDTDFTATLTDVRADGRAIHICEGIRGATFRESLENPTPIEPGRIYRFPISLWETSMVFRAGHRLRLEVSSSNFPRYARNQNTGLPLGTSAETKKAEQTIYHDGPRPSCLVLPVIP